MLARIGAALGILCLIVASAFGQWTGVFNPMFKSTVVVSGYTGPGDVVASAFEWYGLRGYSAAYSTGSNNAITIRRASDNTTQSIVILSNGNLDTATATTFCASTSCFVTTLFDQSGNARDLAQATAANQPQLTFNCLNTNLPCMTFVRATPLYLFASSNPSLANPYSWSAVAERTGSTTVLNTIYSGDSTASAELYFNAANTANVFQTSALSKTANDSVWHRLQATLATGANSFLMVDASDSAATNIGTLSINRNYLGCQSNVASCLDGKIAEFGTWGSAFTGTQRTNLDTNQHNYWGI